MKRGKQMARCLNCMEEYEGFQDECPNCGFIAGTPAKEGFHMNPGVELKERYIVGTVTSYGGFGVVYVGWDTVLKCKVAIKEYFPSGLITREIGSTQVHPVKNARSEKEFHAGKERFLMEAQIMSKFDGHPNIVSIMDYFEENGTAYIVMEFLEGQSLKGYIKSMEELGEKVDIDTAVEITKSMCDILAELHKENILHRDIAPDNIFICLGGKVKLIDFGAARLAEKDKQLTKVLKMGFAPPEQYSTDKEQGTYTDVYALGATLYRTITGKMPDEASNRAAIKEGAIAKNDTLIPPNEINPDIPEQLSNTILRAMAITPGMRFQTMQEFKEALEGKTKSLDPRTELKRRKRRRIIGVAVATLVIGIGAMIGFNMYQDKKIDAELPASTITVWVPSVSGDAIRAQEARKKNMDIMVAEFQKNYPHVKVDIVPVENEIYAQKLEEAKQNKCMPTLFLQENVKDDSLVSDKAELTPVLSYIRLKDYYFESQLKDIMGKYSELPTGYVETMLYVKKGARELNDEERIQLLASQCEKGFEPSRTEFETGVSNYLIAGNDYYYDIFENSSSDQLEVNHIINAGNVQIEPLLSNKKFGYLTDSWSISVQATENEKKCAYVLLAYFLQGNCQRSFFTVEGEKQSKAAPLLKDIYDRNYFQNIVGRKMEFLKEDIGGLVLINEYADINEYYKKILEQCQN